MQFLLADTRLVFIGQTIHLLKTRSLLSYQSALLQVVERILHVVLVGKLRDIVHQFIVCHVCQWILQLDIGHRLLPALIALLVMVVKVLR